MCCSNRRRREALGECRALLVRFGIRSRSRCCGPERALFKRSARELVGRGQLTWTETAFGVFVCDVAVSFTTLQITALAIEEASPDEPTSCRQRWLSCLLAGIPRSWFRPLRFYS